MTDTPDFPALVGLANRLDGKDRETCELALYTLKKQDERLVKRDARIAELMAALKPFSDEAGVGPMPGQPDDPRHCNMKFLRAARETYLGVK